MPSLYSILAPPAPDPPLEDDNIMLVDDEQCAPATQILSLPNLLSPPPSHPAATTW